MAKQRVTLIAYLFASTAIILWAASGVYLFTAVALQESPRGEEALHAEHPTRPKPISMDDSMLGAGKTRQSPSQTTDPSRKANSPIVSDPLHGGSVAATPSPQSNASVAESQDGSGLEQNKPIGHAGDQVTPPPLPAHVESEAPAPPRSDADSGRPNLSFALDGRRSTSNGGQTAEILSVPTGLAPAGALPPSLGAAILPPPKGGSRQDESGSAGNRAQTSAATVSAPIQPPSTTPSSASDVVVSGPRSSAALSAREPETVGQPATTASISAQNRPQVPEPSPPAAAIDGFDQPPANGGAHQPTQIERNRSTANNPFGHIKHKVARKAPRAKESPGGVVTSNRSEIDDAETTPALADEVDKAGAPTELTPRFDHPDLSKPSLKRRCPAVLKASDDFSEQLVELCRTWASHSAGE